MESMGAGGLKGAWLGRVAPSLALSSCLSPFHSPFLFLPCKTSHDHVRLSILGERGRKEVRNGGV
jgi:hypothetical protein